MIFFTIFLIRVLPRVVLCCKIVFPINNTKSGSVACENVNILAVDKLYIISAEIVLATDFNYSFAICRF